MVIVEMTGLLLETEETGGTTVAGLLVAVVIGVVTGLEVVEVMTVLVLDPTGQLVTEAGH